MKAKILSWMNVSLTRKELEDVLKDTDLEISYRDRNGDLVIVDDICGGFWTVRKERNFGIPGVVRYNIDSAFENYLSRCFKKDLRV